MYFIIGGDGKQYGPISERDIRAWIAEGRLNQQSQARTEGETDFRPLSTFPELADAFGLTASAAGVPPLPGAGMGTQQAAADMVKVPAIGLIVAASISIIMSLYGLATLSSTAAKLQEMEQQMSQMNSTPQTQQFMDEFVHFFSGPFGIINAIFQTVISVLILVGAIKMLKLKSYEFAFAAAIMAVVPCITPCCGWILGLIFGIWAMITLRKPEVKSQFL
jgi:H+/gluconate symporter-like permease